MPTPPSLPPTPSSNRFVNDHRDSNANLHDSFNGRAVHQPALEPYMDVRLLHILFHFAELRS